MDKLQGKVAVITGGSSGIGLAAAKLFVAEGAYVFITGRRQKELDEAVRVIGGNVTGIQGDVANLGDLDRLYENVNATGRRIDIVFANAGIAEFAALGDITEAHFDKLFNTNVKGVLFTVQKALPLLNDGASIILTGSVASAKGTPAFWVYGATKAAIRNFVRGWTVELKDRRIRSNVLSRGQLIPRSLVSSLRTLLRGFYRPSRWDAWGKPTKLPKLRCFSHRMTRVSSRASNSSWTGGERRSEHRDNSARLSPTDWLTFRNPMPYKACPDAAST